MTFGGRLLWTPIITVLVVVAVAGCTPDHARPNAETSGPTPTTTAPALAGGSGEGSRAPSTHPRTSSAPTRSVTSGAVTRTDGPCPWIDTETAAKLEGNLIGRVVVSRRAGRTVGCEFHFDTNWGPDRLTMTITAQDGYPDANAARNAMVRRGTAGRNAIGQPNVAAGVDGIRYQSPLDGPTDWAFSFAKGTRVVTVKTDQPISVNAYNVARAIVGRV